jgi:predicted  nucleic acid-binding Zn-ribbon protein
MEKEFIKEINMLNDEIDINKKKEADFMKEVKNLADEIVKIDKLIKGKQKE